MRFHWKCALFGVISVFLVSCVSRSDLDEIKGTQKQILTKLDELAKRPAAAPQRPKRPRGPDPKSVYAFPVDNSPMMGPKDALVTIIEISDFQ